LSFIITNRIIDAIKIDIVLHTNNSFILNGFSKLNQPPLNSSATWLISKEYVGGLSLYAQKPIAYITINKTIKTAKQKSTLKLLLGFIIIKKGSITLANKKYWNNLL